MTQRGFCPALGCGKRISGYQDYSGNLSHGCFPCWKRLPHNLRAALVRASQAELSANVMYSNPDMRGDVIHARNDIEARWAENPPAWKRK